MYLFGDIEIKDGILTALVVNKSSGNRENITAKIDGSYHSSKNEDIVKETWELLSSVLLQNAKEDLLNEIFQEELLMQILTEQGFRDNKIKVIKTYFKKKSEPSRDVFCDGIAMSFFYKNNGIPYCRYVGTINQNDEDSINTNTFLKAKVILNKMKELSDSYFKKISIK